MELDASLLSNCDPADFPSILKSFLSTRILLLIYPYELIT